MNFCCTVSLRCRDSNYWYWLHGAHCCMRVEACCSCHLKETKARVPDHLDSFGCHGVVQAEQAAHMSHVQFSHQAAGHLPVLQAWLPSGLSGAARQHARATAASTPKLPTTQHSRCCSSSNSFSEPWSVPTTQLGPCANHQWSSAS